jgi:hypothetical protein
MDDLKRAARKRAEADRALRPTKRSTGVVTAIVDSTHVVVNIGTRSVKATVPASVRGVGEGTAVLLREGNESVIESALSATVAFSAYITGSVTLAAAGGSVAYTRIGGWTVDFDPLNLLDETTGFGVVPQTRVYEVAASLPFATVSARRFFQIEVGTGAAGSNPKLVRFEGPTSGYSAGSVYRKLTLTAGDSISLVAAHDNASSITARGDLADISFSIEAI